MVNGEQSFHSLDAEERFNLINRSDVDKASAVSNIKKIFDLSRNKYNSIGQLSQRFTI